MVCVWGGVGVGVSVCVVAGGGGLVLRRVMGNCCASNKASARLPYPQLVESNQHAAGNAVLDMGQHQQYVYARLAVTAGHTPGVISQQLQLHAYHEQLLDGCRGTALLLL